MIAFQRNMKQGNHEASSAEPEVSRDKELNDLRQKIAGLHFNQEALAKGERDILYLAESLLRWIDKHNR